MNKLFIVNYGPKSSTVSLYIYINFLASLLSLLTRIPISNNDTGDFILALLVSALPGFVWYQKQVLL